MILHFININRMKLGIIFFVFMSTLSNSSASSLQKNKFLLPDKSGTIFWKCTNNICNIYLKRKNVSSIILRNSLSPSVEPLSRNLVKLFFSCGSPCNYTIFFDSKNGISQSFEFVVAVDITREVVVIAKNNHLIGYNLFDKIKQPLFKIKRDWSPTATLFSDIIEAKFINDALYIKYLEGRGFKETTDIIHVYASS